MGYSLGLPRGGGSAPFGLGASSLRHRRTLHRVDRRRENAKRRTSLHAVGLNNSDRDKHFESLPAYVMSHSTAGQTMVLPSEFRVRPVVLGAQVRVTGAGLPTSHGLTVGAAAAMRPCFQSGRRCTRRTESRSTRPSPLTYLRTTGLSVRRPGGCRAADDTQPGGACSESRGDEYATAYSRHDTCRATWGRIGRSPS